MTDGTGNNIWRTKLLARLHDPAEKALVLFRDPVGHEGGTSRRLRSVIFQGEPDKGAVDHVKRADWWASAADRPQLPKTLARTPLRWTQRPILIHPLTGKEFRLHSLVDTEISSLKDRSFEHFKRLIVRKKTVAAGSADIDLRRTLLAYWRFGPEIGAAEDDDNSKLGELWQHLPADTRIPDHTIWDHLDLTSAFAGAFAADQDGEVALLTVSIGPVQPFIAAARSTSDLWAGSHLLARLAWEAMRVACEMLGPDAILFPRLRGIPQVDMWLRDECGLEREWFDSCAWTKSASDANPLFAATLPNRFVAVVPAGAAAEIAQAVTEHVRSWLGDLGGKVVDRLLEEARVRSRDEPRDKTVHAYRQMRDQIEGFPEVHWAAVPFSLIRPRSKGRQNDLDTARLSEAMAPFFGVAPGKPCGFLDSCAWRVLRKELRTDDDSVFYSPNPGVLYPAVYDLSERVLAAAKSVRPFKQFEQHGWRCSLTGESEWLTTDAAQLKHSHRERNDTLWAKVARHKPAWAKKNEHLGALSAIKRVWPTLFAKEAGGLDRFVVSTHTMALAAQIKRWLDRGGQIPDALRQAIRDCQPEPCALPRRISDRHRRHPAWDAAKKLPELLAAAREADSGSRRADIERVIREAICPNDRIETYFGLLLMDGDRMGRILSGSDPAHAIDHCASFHPDTRRALKEFAHDKPGIDGYLRQKRAMSPNRHLAISAALNEFALRIVPEVIERERLGRVLYAGGDDVLAMLPASDLLPAMRRLRYAWSGTDPDDESRHWRDARRSARLVCKEGFAALEGRLLRTMGDKATASCGAVVAHHQAPLAGVLRELRAAERRAKDAGRDCFNVTVVKRSGGNLALTARWTELPLLLEVRDFLGEPDVSRRAVYHVLTWLQDLPDDADADMLQSMIAWQFDRQAGDAKQRHDLPGLAERLVEFAQRQGVGAPASVTPRNLAGARASNPLDRLENFLAVAEFLAREARFLAGDEGETTPEPVAARAVPMEPA